MAAVQLVLYCTAPIKGEPPRRRRRSLFFGQAPPLPVVVARWWWWVSAPSLCNESRYVFVA